jgi:hypothetical protein
MITTAIIIYGKILCLSIEKICFLISGHKTMFTKMSNLISYNNAYLKMAKIGWFEQEGVRSLNTTLSKLLLITLSKVKKYM